MYILRTGTESLKPCIVLAGLVVFKIVFCSKFPDILDNPGRKTRRSWRTQAVAKRYAFHANAITNRFPSTSFWNLLRLTWLFYYFVWDSLHARLNIYYQAWSCKKKKKKKIKSIYSVSSPKLFRYSRLLVA